MKCMVNARLKAKWCDMACANAAVNADHAVPWEEWTAGSEHMSLAEV